MALPSLVSAVSKRAVEVRRFSRDGKVLHPAIRPAPRQRAKMYSATTVRTFVAPRIGQLLSFILVLRTRKSLVLIAWQARVAMQSDGPQYTPVSGRYRWKDLIGEFGDAA